MSEKAAAPALRAKYRPTRALFVIVLVFLGLLVLSVVLVMVPSPVTGLLSLVIGGVAGIGILVCIILLLVFYLIWIYEFHKTLKEIDPAYGVTPGQAIAQILIPGYNLWGFWNIHGKYAAWLRAKDTPEDQQAARTLASLIPVYYVVSIVASVIGAIAGNRGLHLDWLEAVSRAFLLGGFLAWFKMAEIMQDTLAPKMKERMAVSA
jgi:hypothetical protein